jgi:hypothetical protein
MRSLLRCCLQSAPPLVAAHAGVRPLQESGLRAHLAPSFVFRASSGGFQLQVVGFSFREGGSPNAVMGRWMHHVLQFVSLLCDYMDGQPAAQQASDAVGHLGLLQPRARSSATC